MRPSTKPASEPFPVKHAAHVEPLAPERRWLVEDLWLAEGVGILGGAPKCWKTWLAAELAVAVATGTPALGRFAVRDPGPALLFCAEDSPATLRQRLDGLVSVRNRKLADVPLLLLDVDVLRLDRQLDLERLTATVARTKPKLLVLDPFVRLARIDENSATEVSAVLGALRALQREHGLAVLVVHHARKSPAAHPGQSLRGSSDFAAWGDSNLYLARSSARRVLTLEHRSAAAPSPLELDLVAEPATHLVVVSSEDPTDIDNAIVDDTADQVLRALRDADAPLTKADLRERLHRRNEDVRVALDALYQRGLARRGPDGWSATSLS
jgi:hypothetical protein